MKVYFNLAHLSLNYLKAIEIWGVVLIRLESWAQSDIGKKRSNNEDAYYMDDEIGLYIVADGVGGHKGGDRASELAVKTVASFVKRHLDKYKKSQALLDNAFRQAAKEVYLESLSHPSLEGMGTTLSACLFDFEKVYVSHIGDSRIYCVRNKDIYQVTTDHSLVNERVQAGIMTVEEARISVLRNIITRAIGQQEEVVTDNFFVSLQKNDVFLLCTDGLNSMLLDEQIFKLIDRYSGSESVESLVNEANKQGGDDNITVVLIRTT